jgi:hypothetical protein
MRPDIPDTRLCVADMPGLPRFLFLMWSIGMALLGGRDVPEPVDVTLLDGYWMKHAASEIVYGLPQPWVEAVAAGLPRPDAVIYLGLDPAEAWKRRQHRDIVPYECGMDAACTYEADPRRARHLVSPGRLDRAGCRRAAGGSRGGRDASAHPGHAGHRA